MDKYFLLFSNCIPVKGAKRSVICDLQTGKLLLIPNDLYDILEKHRKNTLKEIVAHYGDENVNVILSYFKLLEDNEMVFFADNYEIVDSFPNLKLDWDFPAVITNSIIDFGISRLNVEYLKSILEQLQELNCHFIQLRFFTKYTTEEVSDILSIFSNSCIESIEIVLPYEQGFANDEFKNFLLSQVRIFKVVLYGAPEYYNKKYIENQLNIYWITDHIESEKSCGIIAPDSFTSNVQLFSEAQLHNTCLNRKISIDMTGEIKNCPSMSNSYGNIVNTNLADVINNSNFTQVWTLNKDKINVCKDCEFRYVCTDCRAYLDSPLDLYSKPLKCGYDPYTCKWEDWSKNPLRQQAIEHYNIIL